MILTEDVGLRKASVVQLAAVELQANDSKHQDSKEQEEADLQQRHHRLDDGLQHDLQTWCYTRNCYFNITAKSVAVWIIITKILIQMMCTTTTITTPIYYYLYVFIYKEHILGFQTFIFQMVFMKVTY